MYDIHCHILPGFDDGADTLDETLRMAELAVSGHTRGLICTPHSNLPGLYTNDYSPAFDRILAKLQTLLQQKSIPLRLFGGQEICLSGRFPELLKDGRLIPLNRSVYLLCEFLPDETLPSALRKLNQLLALGFIPIVAHPERYPFFAENPDAAAQMKAIGCLLQINKGSLKGAFGREAAALAHRLLEDRMADFVASDAHSPYMRTPYLLEIHEYISENFSFDYADYLLDENPLRVIRNQKIYRY